MNAIPKKEKKTADPREYMRLYKQQKYKENPDAIKNMNKMYYHKYKLGLSNEDMNKYGNSLHLVGKIRKHLNELKLVNPDFVKDILGEYLEEIKEEEEPKTDTEEFSEAEFEENLMKN
jgi:hypothetical protein